MLAAHSDLWNWCLTAHVPLQMPATPRPGTRVDPPSLEAQAAVAPRHTRSGGAVAASQLTGTIGSTMAKLSLDDDFVRARERAREGRPKHMVDGLLQVR